MKKVILAATSGIVCVCAFAQGTLNFANFGAGANAPVYDIWGNKLAGAAWEADLYWAPGTVTDSTVLTALGEPAVFASSGYFLGGSRTILGQPAGSTITAQVRVWDTADGGSWAAVVASASATARVGESVLFQLTLTQPPETPHSLTGLNGHPFIVGGPEPSTLALVGLGLAGIWCRRRIWGKAPRLAEKFANLVS